MERFGIQTNIGKDKGLITTKTIQKYIINHGKTCILSGEYENQPEAFISQIDCLLVLGGDGTLIEAARQYAKYQVPMIGINMGTLGFLTSVEQENMQEALDALMNDQYVITRRMMLEGKVYHKDELVMTSESVNDIVVSRTGFSRLVELKVYINDELIDNYVADGVIISTPTGSTGYNLSAGGPVIYPETELMAITPICPHSLATRSIVVSGNERIMIEIGKRSKTQQEEALATYDGQDVINLGTSDKIEVNKSNTFLNLIEIKSRSFYQVLRNKVGKIK